MVSMVQSSHADAPSSTGAPDGAALQPSAANFSAPGVANRRHTSSWSEPRTFTQNDAASRTLGKVVDDLPGKKATNGGSSETEVKEPTANPAGWPAESIAVMIVTPV